MRKTKTIKSRIKKTTPVKAATAVKKSTAAKVAPAVKAAVTRKPAITKKAAAAAVPSRIITTEVIAARAYTLWEQDGRPNGRDVEYWLQAEHQLKQATQSFAA